MDDGIQDVRAVAEVKAEMLAIADRCEGHDPEDRDLGMMAERGLSLVLELRVPRMPDSDEELAAMLARSEDGPTYSSDEVFERLREHSATFGRFLARFRTMVAEGDLEGAARCLGPEGGEGSLEWRGPQASIGIEREGSVATATVSRDRKQEICTSRRDGAALLGAVMRCHARWDDIRRD